MYYFYCIGNVLFQVSETSSKIDRNKLKHGTGMYYLHYLYYITLFIFTYHAWSLELS